MSTAKQHAPPAPDAHPLSALSEAGGDQPCLGHNTQSPSTIQRTLSYGTASQPLYPNTPLMRSPPPCPASTPQGQGRASWAEGAPGPQHRPASPRFRQSLRSLSESRVPEPRAPYPRRPGKGCPHAYQQPSPTAGADRAPRSPMPGTDLSIRVTWEDLGLGSETLVFPGPSAPCWL